MSRRGKPKEAKRDWRWWVNIIISILVVTSMVFGSILIFIDMSPRQSLPTIQVPTAAPTPVPTSTPTPRTFLDKPVEIWLLPI